ncbi:Crp/Fnr family transcriptional regulator [Bradyrhizobium retamae]|uniref:Crp/Fnr family transcriptional regulator n=1 Tax=Bradyrhizobium retamae TaxID=1300035 RepID=A0A0R3NCB4_9BRAD|nr:Crp/Fnr family transcriptional regulator [Bradyrhizobium retamae]KRR27637.1 Crp/Fnr family transcriptional regulator [Bradyrhizobium retamae]
MDKAAATSILLKRLRVSTNIDEEDQRAINALPIALKQVRDEESIVSTGDRPSACCLLVDGFIFRSKVVGGGKRQVIAFHQPGDIPDLQSLYIPVLDHDVTALGDCVLGFISHAPLRALVRHRPNVAEILWRDTLIDAAIFREWICNVGHRSGISRTAHVIFEIYTRLKAVQRTKDKSFQFPATQVLLGEAVGLSAVHVNRVMQELREKGLLRFERGTVTILDEAKLKDVADFDPLYLHLDPAL